MEVLENLNWQSRLCWRQRKAVNPLAQPLDPGETVNLTLELDATDELEDPDNNQVAVIAGVADRLAALEMLLYPPGNTGSAD